MDKIFTVFYEIEIAADSPEDAAARALAVLRDRTTTPRFDVMAPGGDLFSVPAIGPPKFVPETAATILSFGAAHADAAAVVPFELIRGKVARVRELILADLTNADLAELESRQPDPITKAAIAQERRIRERRARVSSIQIEEQSR